MCVNDSKAGWSLNSCLRSNPKKHFANITKMTESKILLKAAKWEISVGRNLNKTQMWTIPRIIITDINRQNSPVSWSVGQHLNHYTKLARLDYFLTQFPLVSTAPTRLYFVPISLPIQLFPPRLSVSFWWPTPTQGAEAI